MNLKDFETTPDGGFLVTFTEVLNVKFDTNEVVVWPPLLVEIPKAVAAIAQFFNQCQLQDVQFLINQEMIVAVYETSQAGPTVSGTSCLPLYMGGWISQPPKSTTPMSPAQFVTSLSQSTSAFRCLSGVNNFDIAIRFTVKFSDLNSGIGIPFIKVPKKDNQLAQAFNNVRAIQQHNIIKAMCQKKEDDKKEEDDEDQIITNFQSSIKKKKHH